MESLQERKRKSSGSGCVADGENQLNEESTGKQTPKLLKMEFFSRDNPWPKCINLNKLSLTEILINIKKTILNSDEECSGSSSGISSADSEEHDEESKILQSLERSHVDINEDGEKSSDQVSTIALNSGEKCSANSSGTVSMENDKHIKESIKSFEPNRVNTTPNKNDDKSSIEVSTKTTKIVLNSPEKCVASSSVINSVENEKHNKESITKSLEPNHKGDEKSLDKELPADSSANTSIKNNPHEASLQKPDLSAMVSENYSDMTDQQKRGWEDAIKIRQGIQFFLTNGYFKENYIKNNKHIYELFVKFFNTNLKDLTIINHGMKIFDKDERKEVITDSLFIDDDGRIFMYFWTTSVHNITQGSENSIREYYEKKVNGHRHILEKPQNGYNIKISDTVLVRLNPDINEAEIGKFDRIVDNAILQQMIRCCR